MENQEKSVGAIVYKEDSEGLKFLILNRSDKKEDFWEYPKGHQEKNETDECTLNREIREELGIKTFKIIDGYKQTISYVSNSSGKIRKLVYYLLSSDDEIILSKEHSDLKWISLENAKSFFEYHDMVELLEDAKKYIQNKKTKIKISSKINIVVPCRNVAKTITKTVDSVISQVDNTNGKLVLVENDSEDNTQEVLEKISKKSQNIILKKSQRGKINALLKGFEEFDSFEPIFCIDGDSWAKYRNFSLALQEFQKHPELKIVGGVPKIEEFEIKDSLMSANLSGIYPRSKKVTDNKCSFNKAFEDPQDNLPPEIEINLKPFFHGRLFCLRNKSVVPNKSLNCNLPDDVYWNRYIFNKYGENSIRILQKLQVYYEPFKSMKELISYCKRIKVQVNKLLKIFPEYSSLKKAFEIYRDQGYVKTLSKKAQEAFKKEESFFLNNKESEKSSWHGEKYDH